MPTQAPFRSEAFAEDLPAFGADAPPLPRGAAGRLLWPLALACVAATVLTLFAPLA